MKQPRPSNLQPAPASPSVGAPAPQPAPRSNAPAPAATSPTAMPAHSEAIGTQADGHPTRVGRLPASQVAPTAPVDRLPPASAPERGRPAVPPPRLGRTSAPAAGTASPRPAPGPPLISLRDVGRRYGGAVIVTALEGATLEIRAGEFVVVLGASGSGKTTLLNLIGALDRASEGDVIVGGRNLSTASWSELAKYRRESVTFIFQTFNLFPALTAIENVEFGASVARRPRPTEAAAEMLARVGLGHRLRHFPHSLSGGEQQRVAIARALATDNRIVLADEPTGELDFRTGLQILQLLQEQALAGRAVIVVTHNREIARVADRVVELNSGRIVSDRRVEGDRPALDDLHW